jgi:hypothetical protein
MATKLKLPAAADLAKLLGSLFDKRIAVTKSAAPLAPSAYRGVCDYVDLEQQTLFVCVCDLPLLAGVGAALAMIPPAVAAESVRAGKPSESLRENAYEVFNIAASMFNEVDGMDLHVKLRELLVGPPVPPATLAKIAKPVTRLDFDVVVPGYPVGKLALLALG